MSRNDRRQRVGECDPFVVLHLPRQKRIRLRFGGKVTATAGTLLNIKPILGFAPDGQLQSAVKVRGRNQVMDKLVALTVKACGEHKRYNLAVASGGSPREDLEKLRAKLITALPDYDHIWEGEIDCTLSTYIGDGILGAAVQVLD